VATVWRGKQDFAAAAAMVFLTLDGKTSTRFRLGFWCDKLLILDEDEVVARLRAPAGWSSGRGRMRMERAAQTRDDAWPRGLTTGLQLAPGLKVARGPPRSFRSPYAGERARRCVAGTVATSLARESEPDARVLGLFHLRRFKNA
jgi:hypothetical protein